jgi:DNA-binding NtrC family response regulator
MYLQVLVVSNNDERFEKISNLLKKPDTSKREIKRVKSTGAFKKSIKEQNADLVILDFSDLELSGSVLIDKVKELDPEVPLILIKDDFDLDEAVKLVKAGATDLITYKGLKRKLRDSVENIFGKSFTLEKN